ncbi:MAG: DUF1552 domain-containing protein [Myxococcaceae bacterium]|nr:DUF1552 domain-containing protein [Myxococcaceae bacterium]
MRRRIFGRRIVLKGFAGAAIGLPLLELTHGEAWANDNPPPQRFVVFFDHGGTLAPTAKDGHRFDGTGAEVGVDAWSPLATSEPLVLGPIQEPLKGLEPYLMVLRGIDNRAGRKATPLDGDHGFDEVTALTCADAIQYGGGSEAAKTAFGPSIETVLAERLAQRSPVPFPAIYLRVDGTNYGTPFFKASQQPIVGQTDPVAAFDTLFSGVKEVGASEEPAAVRARALKKSILDGTAEMLTTFKRRLGARDRQTIDAHFEHIRALEVRVAQLAGPMLPGCEKPSMAAPPVTPEDIAYAHADIAVAALRCGLTHVVGYDLCDLETLWLNPPYRDPSGSPHGLGHTGGTCGPDGPDHAVMQAWIDTMIQNRRWRMTILRRVMDALAAIPEGTGTLLDHSLMLWTSEFSSPFAHSASDVPVLLAGGTSGRFRMGRHLNFNQKALTDPLTREYETKTSLHNLYTSILNAFDYPDEHFGNDQAYVPGPLSGLS